MTAMPTLTNDEATKALAVAKRTICLQLSIHALGTKQQVDASEVTDKAEADRLAVSKDILRMPELREINVIDRYMRLWLRKRAITPEFISGGYYLIATSMLEEVDERLRQYVEARQVLVDRFYADYHDNRDEILAEQRKHLRDVFNEDEYPSPEKARDAFYVTQRYFAFDVPTSLRAVSSELYEREARKQQGLWAEAHAEITKALRVEFQRLVHHMADRLSVVDGKPKVFRDSLVQNFSEFLGTFPFRNVTDDAELSALVQQARKVLSATTPDELRENMDLRASAEQAFAKIRSALDQLVTDAPVRAISFET